MFKFLSKLFGFKKRRRAKLAGRYTKFCHNPYEGIGQFWDSKGNLWVNSSSLDLDFDDWDYIQDTIEVIEWADVSESVPVDSISEVEPNTNMYAPITHVTSEPAYVLSEPSHNSSSSYSDSDSSSSGGCD